VETASNPTPLKTKVLYDGSCPLCSAEVGYYQAIDRAGSLEAIDVNSRAFEDLNVLSHDQAMARFHVLSPSNELLSGAKAFREVWRELPRWKWAAKIADVPAALWLLELAYKGFLGVRPFLVKVFVYFHGAQNQNDRR
jgi:predicted DCC family thiol-disulfide oxidoreductase YuxK